MQIVKKEYREVKSYLERNKDKFLESQVGNKLLKTQEDDFYEVSLDHEQSIVVLGEVNQDVFNFDKNLQYCPVPLGLIVEGGVTVFYNGRAVRHLEAGDVLGLFETAHFLNFNESKKIGNWTLLTEGETKIVFFGQNVFNFQNKKNFNSLESLIINMAKMDVVPKPLTELTLLDNFAKLKSLPLQDETCLLIHTHLLTTTYPLIKHLASVVGGQNVFVVEKNYSTIPSVYEKIAGSGVNIFPIISQKGLSYKASLRTQIPHIFSEIEKRTKQVKISKLIIMDDGGEFLANIPENKFANIEIVGVEQTTRGINTIKEVGQYPIVVNVAGSALKKNIESEFIADATIFETEKMLQQKQLKNVKKIGLIGAGNIGKKIIEHLEQQNKYKISYYDFSKYIALEGRFFENNGRISTLSKIISENDLIIGATGQNMLQGVMLDKIKGNKIFASVSSSDIEFQALLNLQKNNYSSSQNIFENIIIQNPYQKNSTFTILNGGYPINFNRETEVEKPEDIALTRGLLYAGFVQAVKMNTGGMKNKIVRLDVMNQRDLLDEWTTLKQELGQKIYSMTTKEIEKISEGEIFQEENYKNNYALHETTSPYLQMAKKHKNPYTVKVFGQEITVFPGVMTPKYDWAGIFHIETLPDVKGKEVLELGVANGIISIFAGLRGAKKVDAVDINTMGIKNANFNFEKLGLKNCKAFYSDLFQNVKQKYDLVIFNLPYHGNKPQDILEHGVADENYKMMKKFIKQLPKYMKKDGLADIGFSTSGDTPLLLEQFKKAKLEIVKKYSDERFGYNCDIYILKKMTKK